MASSSSSGITFKLHPLVIVNISDHYTRLKAQTLHSGESSSSPAPSNGGAAGSAPPAPPRVFGCVIGVQRGRTVEIFNSFELLFDSVTHTLDRAFLEKKQELCMSLYFSLSIFSSYSKQQQQIL
jgi:COP9 signalosome complex subunit 6